MMRKPEEYARLLASTLCKLHAAESRGPSPLLSDECVRLIGEMIAVAMNDARKEQIESELAALRRRRELAHLHS